MDKLYRRGIQLNLCPTSNVRLCRVKDLSSHPIRTFVEAGITTTINSDDITVFGQTVSEEFLNVYRANILSAQALDIIRRNGLET